MKLKIILLLLFACSVNAIEQPFAQAEMQSVARYSFAISKPSFAQLEPLATVIKVQLPRELKTIQQAIEYLLAPTGYSLADVSNSDPYIDVLYKSLIPEAQRDIGFLSIEDALRMLAGEPWELVEDPVSRLISFEMRANFRAIYNREFGNE